MKVQSIGTVRRKPNLFIVGAARCGTTSVFGYLQTHPLIFMSQPKELAYWSDDYAFLQRRFGLKLDSLDDYMALFSQATDEQRYLGEASPIYLYSQRAIGRIHEFSPDARYIVMLRNPVDMAYSFHAWMLLWQVENVADFRTAWRLQEERAQGRSLPDPQAPTAEFLQYERHCRLGEQVQRMLNIVPEDRIKFVLFDDLVANTRGIYLDILSFLELPDDGRRDFPPLNQSRRVRFPMAGRLAFSPPPLLDKLIGYLRTNHRKGSLLQNRVLDILLPRQKLPGLPDDLRREMIERFRPEVRLLEELIHRDLSHWERFA